MGTIQVRRVQVHTLGQQAFGRCWLSIPGYPDDLIVDGFRLRRRAIDGGLSVMAPAMPVQDQTISCVRFPVDLFSEIRAAFLAEIGEADR